MRSWISKKRFVTITFLSFLVGVAVAVVYVLYLRPSPFSTVWHHLLLLFILSSFELINTISLEIDYLLKNSYSHEERFNNFRVFLFFRPTVLIDREPKMKNLTFHFQKFYFSEGTEIVKGSNFRVSSD